MNPDDVDPQWVAPHRLHETDADPEVQQDKSLWGYSFMRGVMWATLAAVTFYVVAVIVAFVILH